MTREQIRATVLEELSNIAPEADLSALDADAPLRDVLDIDSMDLLNLVIALHRRLEVDIPEADQGRIASLAQLVAYLEARLPH